MHACKYWLTASVHILKQRDPRPICCLAKINIWQTLNLLISAFHKLKLHGEIAPEISRFSMENIHRDFIAYLTINRNCREARPNVFMRLSCNSSISFPPICQIFTGQFFPSSFLLYPSLFLHMCTWVFMMRDVLANFPSYRRNSRQKSIKIFQRSNCSPFDIPVFDSFSVTCKNMLSRSDYGFEKPIFLFESKSKRKDTNSTMKDN